MTSLSWSAIPEERRRARTLLLGHLCCAGGPCEQRHFGLPRAPLTFLYVTVRSMPGPSRVIFFLVMLNSARKELGKIEVSLILPVCGQQRGVLPWDKPPSPSRSSRGVVHWPFSLCLWELRLCELNRSSEMDAFEVLCPTATANIHRIGHWGALMEGLDVTSVTVQPSSTLVPSLASQGSRISNRENIWQRGWL